MTDPASWMGWVRDLGGWAIVVWIVVSLMRRQDVVIDALRQAVESFGRFQEETRNHHEKMREAQYKMLGELKDLRIAYEKQESRH